MHIFLIFINFAPEKHRNLLTSINMAKKVFMISPFEALTGNLSGNQNLQYAENNNPAYEAPNGTQYARNYHTRYVGARRGKDGLVYFQVKQSTATVLTAGTRRNMAIIGVTAAIRSALMSAHASDYATMQRAFDYLKAQGLLPVGQDTFNKWFSAQIKDMLVYKRATWSFTQASISFTVNNPYNLLNATALVIKQSTWVKFANFFSFKGSVAIKTAYVSIDGTVLFCAGAADDNLNFSGAKDFGACQNYTANLSDITVTAESLTYKSLPVYTMAGVQITGSSVLTDGEKLTTADPNI